MDKYLSVLNKLLVARELFGEELPLEQESAYVEQLDALWNALTSDEQKEVERRLHGVPQAPEVLGLVDRSVAIGSCELPRRPQS